MTIDEAIEIIKELPGNLNNVLDFDQQDALNLGTEALKRIQALRSKLFRDCDIPLLGEASR